MSKYNKEELEHLILDEKLSYEEIGRKYGVSGAAIKNAAKRIGIILPVRRKINENETFNYRPAKIGICLNCGKEFVLYKSTTGKYCCSQCQHDFMYKEYIKKWKNGVIDGGTKAFKVSEYIRKYIFEKNNNCCEKCGHSYINPYTNNSILQIHHIDGNCLNNKEENLQLLCPNCHAMTDNYCSRNKNGNHARTKYYGKDKYYTK